MFSFHVNDVTHDAGPTALPGNAACHKSSRNRINSFVCAAILSVCTIHMPLFNHALSITLTAVPESVSHVNSMLFLSNTLDGIVL